MIELISGANLRDLMILKVVETLLSISILKESTYSLQKQLQCCWTTE